MMKDFMERIEKERKEKGEYQLTDEDKLFMKDMEAHQKQLKKNFKEMVEKYKKEKGL